MKRILTESEKRQLINKYGLKCFVDNHPVNSIEGPETRDRCPTKGKRCFEYKTNIRQRRAHIKLGPWIWRISRLAWTKDRKSFSKFLMMFPCRRMERLYGYGFIEGAAKRIFHVKNLKIESLVFQFSTQTKQDEAKWHSLMAIQLFYSFFPF